MPTYPNEAWPADTRIEALDGTTDGRTGLPYIAKGTGPTSTPSYEVQYNRRQARANAILAGWRQGMVVDEGDLRIGVYPIEYTIGGMRQFFEGVSGIAVPDGSARVVYADGESLVHVAEDWPADVTSYLPLATVSAADGELTIEDRRPLAVFHVPSLEAGLVRDRRVVTAHAGSVGSGQSNLEVYRFEAPEAMVLEQVQVYCTGVTATAGVDVKEAGASVLSAPAVPVAGSVVKPAIADGAISAGAVLGVHVTTDGTGQVSGLTVALLLKAAPAA